MFESNPPLSPLTNIGLRAGWQAPLKERVKSDSCFKMLISTFILTVKALLFLGMNLSNPSLLELAELFLVFGSSKV